MQEEMHKNDATLADTIAAKERLMATHLIKNVEYERMKNAYKAKMREAQDVAMQDLTDQSQEFGVE